MTFKISENITDTIVVALLTVLGYVMSYEYEKGYCSYYKIPVEFISINATSITYTICGLTIYLIITFNILLHIHINLRSQSFIKRKTTAYFVEIIIAMFILWIIGFSTINFILLAIVVFIPLMQLLILLMLVIYAKFTKNDSYIKKAEIASMESNNTTGQVTVGDMLINVIGPKFFITVLVALVVIALSYAAGRQQAQSKTKFMVGTLGAEKIFILRQYADLYIGVTVSNDNKINNKIYLLDNSNIKECGPLAMTYTGRLKPNSDMEE